MVELHAASTHALAAVEAREVGHERLEHEHAVLVEVRGDPPKQRTCVSWSGSAKNVLKATKTSAEVPSTGTSAKSPIVTGIASPPGFARSRSTMRSEASIAVHLDSAGGERERDPPGADRELEHAPVAGELGEKLDRARRDRARRTTRRRRRRSGRRRSEARIPPRAKAILTPGPHRLAAQVATLSRW